MIKGQIGVRSVKNFIKTAFEPLGKVMYIYGGGWNEDDTEGGIETVSYGLSPKWEEFEKMQDKNYNYRDYDYKIDKSVIHKGLDCSGYVGWVIYNTLGEGNYVVKSSESGYIFEKRGLGKVIGEGEQKPGNIMFSSNNHIYISLGLCSDKSALLIHSSPPGVQLSGTYSPDGNRKSEAVYLAQKYMKKYCNKWYKRFPLNERGCEYLNEYMRFQWDVLEDREGYENMSPEEVLMDLCIQKELS